MAVVTTRSYKCDRRKRQAAQRKPEASEQETSAPKLGHYSLDRQTMRCIQGCLDNQTHKTGDYGLVVNGRCQ